MVVYNNIGYPQNVWDGKRLEKIRLSKLDKIALNVLVMHRD